MSLPLFDPYEEEERGLGGCPNLELPPSDYDG
jgi:hypothetical protein